MTKDKDEHPLNHLLGSKFLKTKVLSSFLVNKGLLLREKKEIRPIPIPIDDRSTEFFRYFLFT